MALTAKGISKEALHKILGLMSTPGMKTVADNFQSSVVFDELRQTKLLSPTDETQGFVWVDDEARDLEPDPDKSGYRYFSVVRGWVHVPTEEVIKYRVNPQRLLEMIQGWLEINTRQPVNALQDNAVWDLGDIWLGKKHLAVLFMRRASLPESVSALKNVLMSFPRRRSVMVLTDRPISAYGPDLPGEPVTVALEELLLPEQEIITHIDKEVISDLCGYVPKRLTERLPVYCSEDGGQLTVNDNDYTFTGMIHRCIIRQLYEAWRDGRPRLKTDAVLENAESKAATVGQAFKGYQYDWKSVIGYGNGYCWLIV